MEKLVCYDWLAMVTLLVIVSCHNCCVMQIIGENIDNKQCYWCRKWCLPCVKKSYACIEKLV